METATQFSLIAGMPLGMYSAKVEDTGRLKLPKDFNDCLSKTGLNGFFITSLDRQIGRIYPILVWRENLQFLASYCEDPQAAEDVRFNADDLGAEVVMDHMGRMMLPAELRRELNLDTGTIRLRVEGAYIELLNEAAYNKRKERAAASGPEAVHKLQKAGFK